MSRAIEQLITDLKAAAHEEIMFRESGDTSDRWQNDATPENVLKLVEALSAKQAEPVYWEIAGHLFTTKEDALKPGYRGTPEPLYEEPPSPQLNSLVVPEGWIKCSDRIPDDDDARCLVYCVDGVRRIGFINHGDWAIHGKYYDESFVTHWMPLPAAPEKP